MTAKAYVTLSELDNELKSKDKTVNEVYESLNKDQLILLYCITAAACNDQKDEYLSELRKIFKNVKRNSSEHLIKYNKKEKVNSYSKNELSVDSEDAIKAIKWFIDIVEQELHDFEVSN